MFQWLNDIDNYESRKVDRTECIDDIIVSTVWTSDEGYETALVLPDDKIVPVERYSSIEDAEKGHERWIDFVNNSKENTVIKLGWLDDLVEDEEVLIR